MLSEIKEAYSTGIINGVTTNPSLLKKAVDKRKNLDLENYIKEILKTARGTPVSLEVTEISYEGMVEQGKKLFKKFNRVAGNVYIKIPINPSFTREPSFDGIRTIKTLSKKNIPINTTLIFTPEQALIAAKAGAKIVSPFAGRIDDLIRKKNKIKFKKEDYFPTEGYIKKNKLLGDNGIVSGIDLVSQIVKIFEKYEINCEVLAASMRNPRQVREAALAGADIATLPFNVIQELLTHVKTQEGMKDFINDSVKKYKDLTKSRWFSKKR